MEHPSSQLENLRPSNLKPPSKLPALTTTSVGLGRTLLETSQSDLNARTAGHLTGMAPPNGSIKHKLNGLPESAPKRKTLIERAGEPINPLRSHIPSTTKTGRPESAGGLLQSRTHSIPTGHQRNASNASTTASLSGVPRPPSRQRVPKHMGMARPPSVIETPQPTEEEEADSGVSGKRKGTPISLFNPKNAFTVPKMRAPKAPQHITTSTSASPPAETSIRSQHSASRIRLSSSSSSDGTSGGYESSSSDHEQSSRSTSSSSGATVCRHDTKDPSESIRDSSLVAAFEGLSLTQTTQNTNIPALSSQLKPKHRPSLQRIKEELSPSKIPKFSCTPSLIHKPSFQQQSLSTPSTSPLKHKQPSTNGLRTPGTGYNGARHKQKTELPVYLTKEKLTPTPAWDTKGRLEDMESLYATLKTQFESAADSKSALEESLGLFKSRVQELSQANKELSSTNRDLATDLDRARNDLHTTTSDLRQARRDHERDVQEVERKHERALGDLYSKQEKEGSRLEREIEKLTQQGEKDLEEARRAWEKQKDDALAELTTQHWDEVAHVKAGHGEALSKLQGQLDELQKSGESRATESATEVQDLRDSMEKLEEQLQAAKTTMSSLRSQNAAAESRNASLEQEKAALVSKTHFLEGNQEAQSHEFSSMSERLQDAIDARDVTLETLRKEEMLRRKLNATILELRGNIRVFVRLRPLLSGEEDPAKVDYPDMDSLDGGKEMTVFGPTTLSATGKERREKHDYAFDRVFGPTSANSNVFDDCRDLIQSVVDGYNVSILSYGQTGSGKTFGMSGPNGIIPSSINLLLAEMHRLKQKDWSYTVSANFVEVYNETLNDLLGDAKTWDDNADDLNSSVKSKKKEKHEIHHDATTGKTTVTNLTSVSLWPPPEDEGQWPPAAPVANVESGNGDDVATPYTERAATQLLETAAKNRRVAATKANERSSRSHSVFILTLKGHCATTGENSEGILNLVDLAGSERLKQSGAEGSRMKETQAINKSLSALGDVIAALGSKKGDDSHIPYRNSKLTYLLQSSLGGTIAGKSSRTLMLLHLSPLQAHWQESRSSLLFGSKVHGTHIGTAKKR